MYQENGWDMSDAGLKYQPILRGFRYRGGLTQKQLADAVSVKQNHISEMERGTRKISPNMAKRFAEFFHTSEKAFIS